LHLLKQLDLNTFEGSCWLQQYSSKGILKGRILQDCQVLFLQSPLHSPRAILSRYRRWSNKVSNLKGSVYFTTNILVATDRLELFVPPVEHLIRSHLMAMA